MTLQQAITELNSLAHACATQRYISHYIVERRLETLLKSVSPSEISSADNAELLKELKRLQAKLKSEVDQLKKSNETMIKALNFEETCKQLINANDQVNFDGLVNIGEYFGVGSAGKDVSGALDRVYDFYRTTPQAINETNHICLTRLCELLRQPILSVPQHTFHMMQNNADKIKAILKEDSIIGLMGWLLAVKQEDRDFALRCAAAVDTCHNCLLFLLLRTMDKNVPINLLAKGQPSGQTALHRAVKSEKTLTVTLLLDSKFNPSDDLLKQLLVRDQKGLTPADIIETLIDTADLVDCSRMLDRMRGALDKHKDNPRFNLSKQESQSIYETLDRIQAKIKDAMDKVSVVKVAGYTMSFQ